LRIDELHEVGFEGKSVRFNDDDWRHRYSRYVFQYDGRGDAVHKPEYCFMDKVKCDEEMVAVCPFLEWKPHPKPVPLHPRSTWIRCSYCGGLHHCQETANTCRLYHEEFSRLNGEPLTDWLPEGSKETWPPYKTSITDDMIWRTVVDKIIARDQECCTDCGISWAEIKAAEDATRHLHEADWRDESFDHWQLYEQAREQFPAFEVHHIVARMKGGTHHPHNLRLLCSDCHKKYTGELVGEIAQERREVEAEQRLDVLFGNGRNFFKELRQ